MSRVQIYISSVPSNRELKRQQQQIHFVIESLGFYPNIKYLDVASNEEAKKKMKKLTKDPNSEPPHFACGEEYLGDFNSFRKAVEAKQLGHFLRIIK